MLRLASLFRSRIGLRMVTLFVVCAMVPVILLTAVVYRQFTGSLREQSQRRLHELTRTIGMELLERLRRADAELQLVDAFLIDTSAAASLPPQLRSSAAERFRHVALRRAEGETVWLAGEALDFDAGPPHAREGRDAGLTELTVLSRPGMHPQVVLRREAHARRGDELIAVLRDDFLWDHGLVPPWVSFVALGQGKLPLSPVVEEFGSQLPAGFDAVAEAGVGQFEWQHQGEYYWSAYWSVGLRADFLTSPWTLVVSQPRQDALAPIASAGSTIGYVSGASLLAVMLLSLVQVRRNLVPLTRLQEGTRRLGQGDFDHDVDLTSGDEFEELAQSFNGMAHRLKRQFHTLSARGELDRAVLSSLDDGAIIRTLLEHLPQLVDCDHVAVMYADRDAGLDMRLFWRSAREGSIGESEVSSVGTDLRALSRDGAIELDRQSGMPCYLEALHRIPWETCVVVPIVLATRPAGVLIVADSVRRSRLPVDLQQIRQLGDQLAVALSNADLVQALDRLNVGTISALGRTVDAKSPWTAGHSQRVMEVAVAIAVEMELPADVLDTIQRGALLHDIGKIAVPSAILNKPGRLSEEEMALLEEHPATGARILEPIPEYGRLIPIVLQHHEWLDGRGYPAGLVGDQISLEARVVAVADVWDALTSERPYREAMDRQEALGMICAGSGTQFDPAVVAAFRRLRVGSGEASLVRDVPPAPLDAFPPELQLVLRA